MDDLLAKLRIGSLVFHAIAAIAPLVLLTQAGVMAGWRIFPGLLIACGSARAMPDRPITLYGAFGSLLGLSFFLAISAMKTGHYITLIPVLMLVIGAAWLLGEPQWPSAIFTWVSVRLSWA